VLEAQTARKSAVTQAAEAVRTITVPDGYSLALEGERIVLSGPFCDDLHARIKRAGGVWDGAAGTNRRVWFVPAAKSASLKRIFANASQAIADSAQARAAKAQAAKHADLLRWLGYVEEKAPDGYLYERGVSECHSRGITQHPELTARLQAAINKATEVRAAQQKRWAEERAIDQQKRAAEQAKAAQSRQRRTLFAVGGGPALNCPVRRGATVRVYTSVGKTFRIDENAPSVYGSHLLGHEGDLGCYYYWREATADEVAELERKESAARTALETARARKTEIKALATIIQATGERPSDEHSPVGRRVLDTQTIYGGGDWFVVGSEWIWYCRNNGADGDDWSANNVRTGGAGAIGWRVPRSEDLVAQLERLERIDA
jgi:hypothetical protein